MIVQNDFAQQWKVIEPAVVEAVRRVGSSGWYILGPEVERFEVALAEDWGMAHAVGVGNGMDALEIGLRCLDLRPGDKVLTTPFSAFATTLAILRAGGLPVFVDVDDAGNIDLDQSREVLSRDASIRFLLPVHLYGNPCDLEKLAALRDDFELRVVEDCAQAIGAKHGGRVVGSVGQVAGTSFYPTKNLGALGDGGALLTNDAQTAVRARMLRNYGQSSHYVHRERGLNSRLDELHAAVLHDALLPQLEPWTAARRRIARRYRAQIQNPALRILAPAEEAESSCHLCPVFVKGEGPGRDQFRDALQQSQIQTGIHYPRIIPDQMALEAPGSCEIKSEPQNARRLAASEVSLPIHPFLRDTDLAAIITACCDYGRAAGLESENARSPSG
jgi:dTDP-3-amino-3,4,6-trideoxy-alpha-D-glucose transaminase